MRGLPDEGDGQASGGKRLPQLPDRPCPGHHQHVLIPRLMDRLLAKPRRSTHFIARTYTGVFCQPEDLRFVDRVSANIATLDNPAQAALDRAASSDRPQRRSRVGSLPSRATSLTTTMAAGTCGSQWKSNSTSRSPRLTRRCSTTGDATR